MAYEKTNWQNSPSTNTPLNADNLNHIEQGIADIDERLNTITNDQLVQGWHANNIFVGLNGYSRIIETEVYNGYTLLYWEGEILCRGKYSNGWSVASATSLLGNDYTGTDSKGHTCVKIPVNSSFIIDLADASNRLKIISRNAYTIDSQVLLVNITTNGIAQGLLVPLITASLEKKINGITNDQLVQGWHANNIFVGLNGYSRIVETEVISGYTLLYWEGDLLCRGRYSNGWSVADATTALGSDYTGTDSKGRTCVKIPQDNSFVIDLNDSSNRLKIVSRGSYSVDTQVLLACVLSIGVTQGMLVPLITASLEKKVRTIDASITSMQAEDVAIRTIAESAVNKTGIDRESAPDWELGSLNANGSISQSTSRMVTKYIEAFDGEKIIIEPKYNNGIYVAGVSFLKNSLGDYYKKELFAVSTLYANGTRSEIVVPYHCFIRIGAYYRYDPALTEDSMTALANMIYIQSSKTLLEYNQNLDQMYEYPYTPGSDFIIANRDLQNKNTISFVWASDTHHSVHNSSSPTLSGLSGLPKDKFAEMANVAELVRADFLAITGDIVNGYYPVSEQKFNLLEVVDAVRKNTSIPTLLLEGNHDDNSWYASASGSAGTEYTGLAQVLQNDQFTSYAMNNSIESVKLDKDNTLAGYFYKDFEKCKIRVICLNSTDIPYIENEDLSLKYYGQWTFGFQERQIDWLANKALKFDEAGWGVVLMMHYDSNFTVNTQAQKNIDNVNNVLEAFIEKSSGTTTSSETDFEVSVNYDFTSNPSNEVLAWFSGHRHEDNTEIIDGIPHVMIINTFNATGGGYDVVTLDRSAKKIYTKRYNGEPMTTYNRTITW